MKDTHSNLEIQTKARQTKTQSEYKSNIRGSLRSLPWRCRRAINGLEDPSKTGLPNLPQDKTTSSGICFKNKQTQKRFLGHNPDLLKSKIFQEKDLGIYISNEHLK